MPITYGGSEKGAVDPILECSKSEDASTAAASVRFDWLLRPVIFHEAG